MSENLSNLGFMKLEPFMKRSDGDRKQLKLAFIACGQYGGRQGDEFARLQYTTIAINTAQSDLDDLKVIRKQIKLQGVNGAIKDIERGKQAIKDNRDVIIEVLKSAEIQEADHVFVIGGMGGGTGNAAVPVIASNLASLRNPFNKKPSFGAIISVPGTWEKRGLKKNASWGLAHIDELIKNNRCGAVIIMDNEKLFNMTQSMFSSTETDLEWTDYGNTALAAALSEIAYCTTLPSSKSFDVDEFRDVLSTPGYLSFGKAYIEKEDKLELNQIDNIIQKSFQNSPTAHDYDYELDSVNGFIAILHPPHSHREGPTLNEKIFRIFQERFGHFIANAEKPHTGMIENKSNKAIVYTGIVCNSLPARINSMLDEIKTEEDQLQKKRSDRDKTRLDLSNFKDIERNEVAAASQESLNSDFDLFENDEPAKKKDKSWDEFKL